MSIFSSLKEIEQKKSSLSVEDYFIKRAVGRKSLPIPYTEDTSVELIQKRQEISCELGKIEKANLAIEAMFELSELKLKSYLSLEEEERISLAIEEYSNKSLLISPRQSLSFEDGDEEKKEEKKDDDKGFFGTIWSAIKKFFTFIWDAITGFFRKIGEFLGLCDKKSEETEKKAEKTKENDNKVKALLNSVSNDNSSGNSGGGTQEGENSASDNNENKGSSNDNPSPPEESSSASGGETENQQGENTDNLSPSDSSSSSDSSDSSSSDDDADDSDENSDEKDEGEFMSDAKKYIGDKAGKTKIKTSDFINALKNVYDDVSVGDMNLKHGFAQTIRYMAINDAIRRNGNFDYNQLLYQLTNTDEISDPVKTLLRPLMVSLCYKNSQGKINVIPASRVRRNISNYINGSEIDFNAIDRCIESAKENLSKAAKKGDSDSAFKNLNESLKVVRDSLKGTIEKGIEKGPWALHGFYKKGEVKGSSIQKVILGELGGVKDGEFKDFYKEEIEKYLNSLSLTDDDELLCAVGLAPRTIMSGNASLFIAIEKVKKDVMVGLSESRNIISHRFTPMSPTMVSESDFSDEKNYSELASKVLGLAELDIDDVIRHSLEDLEKARDNSKAINKSTEQSLKSMEKLIEQAKNVTEKVIKNGEKNQEGDKKKRAALTESIKIIREYLNFIRDLLTFITRDLVQHVVGELVKFNGILVDFTYNIVTTTKNILEGVINVASKSPEETPAPDEETKEENSNEKKEGSKGEQENLSPEMKELDNKMKSDDPLVI